MATTSTRSRSTTPPDLLKTVRSIDDNVTRLADDLHNTAERSQEEFDRIWTALGSIAGIDGVALGLAAIAGLLEPLRLLVPPTTAGDLPPGVGDALLDMRIALGLYPPPPPAADRLPTADFDHPVRFIGEARPIYTGSPSYGAAAHFGGQP